MGRCLIVGVLQNFPRKNLRVCPCFNFTGRLWRNIGDFPAQYLCQLLLVMKNRAPPLLLRPIREAHFFSLFTPFDTNVLNSDTPNILFLLTFMNHYHTHSHTHKSMCTVYLHTFTTQMWVNISYMDPMTSYDYSFMSFHIHVNMRIILMAGQPTPCEVPPWEIKP